MNIIIVGGGKIGTTVLQSLVAEKHDVVMIDNDRQIIEQISNQYDVMCVCGNGVDWETLIEAGAEGAELLVEAMNLTCFAALWRNASVRSIRWRAFANRNIMIKVWVLCASSWIFLWR